MALAQRDIAEAESYAGDGSRPDLAAAAAGVRSVLGTIDQQLKDQRIDPVELQHRLDVSRDQLDRTLGGLRTAAEQYRALRGRLDAYRAEAGRGDEPFAMYASCVDAYDLPTYKRLEEVGMTHLVTMPWYFYGGPDADLPTKLESIKRFSDDVIAKW